MFLHNVTLFVQNRLVNASDLLLYSVCSLLVLKWVLVCSLLVLKWVLVRIAAFCCAHQPQI